MRLVADRCASGGRIATSRLTCVEADRATGIIVRCVASMIRYPQCHALGPSARGSLTEGVRWINASHEGGFVVAVWPSCGAKHKLTFDPFYIRLLGLKADPWRPVKHSGSSALLSTTPR